MKDRESSSSLEDQHVDPRHCSSVSNAGSELRRALSLMSLSSLLVPAAGLMTQPVLSRSLGLSDRGELAAAMAPALLVTSVVTLGLPEALTYYVAKRPRFLRKGVLFAASTSLGLGVLAFGGLLLATPVLTSGNERLENLVLLAAVISIPAIAVGAIRGAAAGLQLWGTIAIERLVVAALRVSSLTLLWLTGSLDLLLAVVISAGVPVLGGLVYVPMLLREKGGEGPRDWSSRLLMSYGSRIWLGSVTEMLMARLGSLIMVPLSSTTELALFTVAVTIADLPIVIVLAIQNTLFGVNSRTRDRDRLTLVSRVSTLYVVVGSFPLAIMTYFFTGTIFGAEFEAAVAPTLLLICSVALSIPGMMAAIGLSAWGRPGFRSFGLVFTLIAYGTSFIMLVPSMGALGGSLASLIGNSFMTVSMIVMFTRVSGARLSELLAVRRTDVRTAVLEPLKLLSRLLRTKGVAH